MSGSGKVKVTTIGTSVGVDLPQDVVARLKIRDGDTVIFTGTPKGTKSRRMSRGSTAMRGES